MVSEQRFPYLQGGFTCFFSIVVIMCFLRWVPAVFAAIFRDALKPGAAVSGICGYGISRSLQYRGCPEAYFSNEAGLGSMAVSAWAAEETTRRRQGMWAMFEVFFDTILICTMTALVILCMTGGDAAQAPDMKAAHSLLVFQTAWRCGGVSRVMAMMLFAFATIIACSIIWDGRHRPIWPNG